MTHTHPAPERRLSWRGVIRYALIVQIALLLPYLLGYITQTPLLQYSGLLIGAEDGYSYIGKIRLGLQGLWQFHLFYTTEPHDPVAFTFLSYIIPGQLLRLVTSPDDPNAYNWMIAVFHLMRVTGGLVLIPLLYAFIARFAPNHRLLALTLATIGGGLGIVLIAVDSRFVPPEWYIPEAFSLLVLTALPHLVWARAAFVAGFLALFASAQRRWSYALLAGILWTFSGLTVPIYLGTLYTILGVWGIMLWIRHRRFPRDLFWRCVVAALITLPVFLYNAYIFSANAFLVAWKFGGGTVLPSPPPLHYLLAYAPLLILGAFALRWVWSQTDEHYLLLLAWALAGLTLVYLPVSVQRRLSEGVLIPLAILAVIGLWRITEQRPKQIGRIRLALLLTTLPTTLILYLSGFGAVIAKNPTLYTPADTLTAMHWLNANALERERGAVVLAPYPVGNRLPAYTNLRPYVGHGPETLNSGEKRAQVEAYFDGEMGVIEAQALYEAGTIDYVFAPTDAPIPRDGLRDLTQIGGIAILNPS